MGQRNKELNLTRHDFLLTFFKECPEYAEKEVNGFWLIKYWDGNVQRWKVAVYSQESYRNYKKFNQNYYDKKPSTQSLIEFKF